MASYRAFLCALYVFTVNICHDINARPTDVDKNVAGLNVDSQSLKLLLEKGYLDATAGLGQLQNAKAIAEALRRFQGFAGIPVTGELDESTKEYMVKPRCGMPDMKTGDRLQRKRMRRYNHQGSKWGDRSLTWALENSNDDGITNYEVRHILTRAFHKWSTVTNLQFRELVDQPENSAKIRVRFVRRYHGDPYSFDGQGGTLAHAFYPMNNKDLSGDIHFDDDEEFVTGSRPTTSQSQKKLLWVAVHEIGHSIGLEHSSVRGAIMWPYYQHFETQDFDLTYDDISGIQTIYGGRVRPRVITTTVAPTSIITRSPPMTRKCVDTMRSAFMGRKKKLHFVNNNKLYVLYDDSGIGIEEGPLPINSFFSHLDKVDAVFLHPYYRTHTVFHGDTFSVYEENKVRYGNQRKIEDGFQGINEKLENVNAAIVWPGSRNYLYIFKGERYWRLRPIPNTMDYKAEYGYPKNIAVMWNGLPKTIDTAFQWANDKIYFTKGDLYYRWDERKQAVHSGYPIKLTRSFLKCEAD